MKLKIWTHCGIALGSLLFIAGCDVHRTDPIPEVAPIIGTPEKEADRARPAVRESARTVDARDRQSRIDDVPSDDARLATEVESALAAEPVLRSGSSIEVRSEDGIVTLRGATVGPEQRMLAAHVARAVQGVRLVRNELTTPGEA